MNGTHDELSLAGHMPVIGQDALHDLWGLYRDGARLRCVAELLARPFAHQVDAVIGAEARGFLLGGIVAMELGVGFVPVRKQGGYLPGETVSSVSLPDWEGKRNVFALQIHALAPGNRVLLVDDWLTTGNQARAVSELLERQRVELHGVAVVVEEGLDALADFSSRLHALLHWDVAGARFFPSAANRLR